MVDLRISPQLPIIDPNVAVLATDDAAIDFAQRFLTPSTTYVEQYHSNAGMSTAWSDSLRRHSSRSTAVSTVFFALRRPEQW